MVSSSPSYTTVKLLSKCTKMLEVPVKVIKFLSCGSVSGGGVPLSQSLNSPSKPQPQPKISGSVPALSIIHPKLSELGKEHRHWGLEFDMALYYKKHGSSCMEHPNWSLSMQHIVCNRMLSATELNPWLCMVLPPFMIPCIYNTVSGLCL